jgi:23S rRNA (cytidine1920-2'-O)/16S rRNA (cytidine1409-2'-O)-methyltransferase
MKGKRARLDVFLAEKGLSDSREKAKRDIMAGWVRVNGETIHEASHPVTGDENIRVERPGGLFVSRGGEKLNHALESFCLDMTGLAALDLGASTGGFTDCMLKRGARRVYAVDVGYGQLDFSLRQDPRVVVMERVNVRNLEPESFPDRIDFISMDLSFISVTKVMPHVRALFAPVRGVMLIKPQFEAEPGEHKKGVVKKRENHVAILRRVLGELSRQGLELRGLCPSPIKGPAGNIEFLLYFFMDAGDSDAGTDIKYENIDAMAERAVMEAHETLNIRPE